MITHEQMSEMCSWLKTDYWAIRLRLYACRNCGTTKKLHRAHGLCCACYEKKKKRKRGQKMDKQKAIEFFNQLKIFSDRVFDSLDIDADESPWGYPEWEGQNFGAIIHSTADMSIERVLKWFMVLRHKAKASAHIVVAKAKIPEWTKFEKGLSLIEALPATVVQCRYLSHPAWHATWTNTSCYGIENINAGKLEYEGGDFYDWRGDKIVCDVYEANGHCWDKYTADQISANHEILKYVDAIKQLNPDWILGHMHVQDNKTDPGPHFPIAAMRMQKQASVSCEFGQNISDALEMGEILDNDTIRIALNVFGYNSLNSLEESIRIFKRMTGKSIDTEIDYEFCVVLYKKIKSFGII